jgi:hypothetical protein
MDETLETLLAIREHLIQRFEAMQQGRDIPPPEIDRTVQQIVGDIIFRNMQLAQLLAERQRPPQEESQPVEPEGEAAAG